MFAANVLDAALVRPVAGFHRAWVPERGGVIRNSFAVGIIAVATLAAAGLLFRRRRVVLTTPGGAALRDVVDDLYAAGL